MFAAMSTTLTRATVLPPMRVAAFPGHGALSGHSGYVARLLGHGALSAPARIYKQAGVAPLTSHGVLSATATSVSAETAAGTSVTTVGPTINASPTPGSVGSGNLLAITSGGQISLNGAVPSAYSPTANVVELYYIDHTAWQYNGTNWYGPLTATSAGSAIVPSPLPVIALSSNTPIPASSPSGTTIGALSVITGLPSGSNGIGAYTWAFALSGTNAADFQVVGGALETAVANLQTGTYTFTVTATATGVAGSYTLPLTVTVAAATTPVLQLSNNILAASSPVGTVVGNLAITGGSGSYTYALSGTNAADFKVVGAALEANVANLAAGTYNVTITATGSGSPAPLAVTVTVSASGPTGTPVTISTQATSDYNYPAGSTYQPANSPWWAFVNACAGVVQGTMSIQCYPNNFPNFTTFSWSNPANLQYPEMICGAQGPNHDQGGGGPVWGPVGTTNGQSSSPPAWVPSWCGKKLSALTQMLFSWNFTINTNTSNDFDCLCETFLGPAGGQNIGPNGPNYETCFILKDPGWWYLGNADNTAVYTATINGVVWKFFPGGEPTASKSLTMVPNSVWAQSGGGNTPWVSGSFDMLPVLAYAASQGWTSMAYSVYGWEFGHEVGTVAGMSGSVTWNSISFNVS